MQVLQQVVKLPVVKVDRERFLVESSRKAELDRKDIPTLIEQGPVTLSLLPQELDRAGQGLY